MYFPINVKGFKVARVEQTETQEAVKERVKESKDWSGKKKPLDKFEKQTRREVCRISTPGTRVSAFTEHENLGAGESLIGAVFEENGVTGVAFCDTSQDRVVRFFHKKIQNFTSLNNFGYFKLCQIFKKCHL